MDERNRDQQGEESTRVKRDTDVRGSLGIPPSGEQGQQSDERSRGRADEERGSAREESDLGEDRSDR